MVVARLQTKYYLQSKKRDRLQTCRWVSSRVELMNNTANSFFTENSMQRVFQNPVTYIKFSNLPFIVLSIRKQHCQFGKQYFKECPATSGQMCPQGTRKIGCLAHIHVHELTLFPSNAVPAESGICSLGSRKLKTENHRVT